MSDGTGKVLGIQISPNKVFFAHVVKDKVNKFLLNKLSNHRLEQTFNHRLIFNSQNEKQFFDEIKSYIESNDLLAESLSLSFTNQSGILHSVKIDQDSTDQMMFDQLEWEFAQISGENKSNYAFSIPDQGSINNERLVIGFYKEMMVFSNNLALHLEMKLSHVSMNLLNLNYLLHYQEKIEKANVILVLLEENYTEIAYHYSEIVQKTEYIEFEAGIDVNTIAINIRNAIDVIKGQISEDKHFIKMFIAGSAASIEIAENLANAMQIGVEIVNPYDNIKLTQAIESNDSVFKYKNNYAVCVGSALQA